MTSRTCGEALEILDCLDKKEDASLRVGAAISAVIPSEVSAIEVFTATGDHAERRWASPRDLIESHFASFLAIRSEHPFFEEFVRSGLKTPVKISDTIGLQRLRSTKMYSEFLRPLGIQRQMGVAFQIDHAGIPLLVIGRSGRDYTEHERITLRNLLPLIERSLALERINARFQLLVAALDRTETALILVEHCRVIVFISELAKDYLRQYFSHEPYSYQALPAALSSWLLSLSQTRAASLTFPHMRMKSKLVLLAHPCGTGSQHVLSMVEELPSCVDLARKFSLSPRQGEILDLIAEGLTNKEIAQRIDRSPHTVRTQVERLLVTLGVANRTAAAVLARSHVPNR